MRKLSGPGVLAQLPFAKFEELLEGVRISHCLESGLNGDYQEHLAVIKEYGYAVNEGFVPFRKSAFSP